MAVAYANATVDRDTDGNETTSINPPASLASGECWIIIVSADDDGGTGTPSTPTDFAQVDAGYGDTDGTYTKAFWKVAGASESAVTSTTGTNWYEVVRASIRFTGTHATTPVGNVTNNFPTGGGANLDLGAVTIATTDNAALAWIAGGSSIAAVTKPANMTLIATNTTSWPGFSCAYASGLTAGSFNPDAWTNSSADPAYTQVFEIVQSAGGGSPVTVGLSGSASTGGSGTSVPNFQIPL